MTKSLFSVVIQTNSTGTDYDMTVHESQFKVSKVCAHETNEYGDLVIETCHIVALTKCIFYFHSFGV